MFDKQIRSLPGAGGALGLCAVASLVVALLTVGQAVALSSVIVGVWNGTPLADVAAAVGVFAACFVARSAVRAVEDARMESYAHRCVAGLRAQLADRLYDAGGAMVARFGSAGVVTGLVDGCLKAEAYLRRTVPKAVSLVVVPLVLCVAVFFQDVVSGAIVLVCYPFIIAFMRLIGYTAADESAKRHDGFVEMSAHFMDALRGMGTLRAFGMSGPYASTVHAASERYRKMVMKTLRIAQLSGAVLDVFATCGLAAVAIMLGFRMVEGSVAFLPALIVLMLVPEYFMPIKSYASDYHASLDGKSALSHLTDMAACGRDTVCMPRACVRVDSGGKVALVGASGAGKSSLLDVMAGASDLAEGDVSVCGVAGAQLASPKWRSRVAYIPQHPSVFAGTLRENVCLYAPDADDEAVWDALGKVGMAEFAKSLPRGLDCRLGPQGRGLSGGEAHRLALARAIVGARDVWLLDEPGASLDEQTQAELMESVIPLMEGRTVVVATHSDCWARAMDEVVEVGSEWEVRHA